MVVRSPSGRLLVFDVAHSEAILLESGLKDLLQSPEWLKVSRFSPDKSPVIRTTRGYG